MRKTWIITFGTLALLGSFTSLSSAALIVTTSITGEAFCATSEHNEAQKCQTAIRVKSGDGSVVYYGKDNKVARKFHPKICKQPAQVTAIGIVRERHGQRQIALKNIWSEKL